MMDPDALRRAEIAELRRRAAKGKSKYLDVNRTGLLALLDCLTAAEGERDELKALRLEELLESSRTEDALRAEAAAYREALVFYADEANYPQAVKNDRGEWARAALAVSQEAPAEQERDEWKASFFTAQDRTNDAEARAERAESEAARLQHIIDCANTPLMRDVMAERDAARAEYDDLVLSTGDEVEAARAEVERLRKALDGLLRGCDVFESGGDTDEGWAFYSGAKRAARAVLGEEAPQ